jgi:hypothetical protein
MNSKPNPVGSCFHPHYRTRVVFTELGCHVRCLVCGALGPGYTSSEAARQAFLVPKHACSLNRY